MDFAFNSRFSIANVSDWDPTVFVCVGGLLTRIPLESSTVMGSTMISCLCNFCAPAHQLEVNPILTDLLSATGSQPKLPLAAKVSLAKGIPCSTTKSNLLHTYEEGTERVVSPKQREPLKFGIEKILYGSSSKGEMVILFKKLASHSLKSCMHSFAAIYFLIFSTSFLKSCNQSN